MPWYCISHYVVGDGRQGWQDKASYDAIHVGAAAASVPEAVRTCTSLNFYTLIGRDGSYMHIIVERNSTLVTNVLRFASWTRAAPYKNHSVQETNTHISSIHPEWNDLNPVPPIRNYMPRLVCILVEEQALSLLWFQQNEYAIYCILFHNHGYSYDGETGRTL